MNETEHLNLLAQVWAEGYTAGSTDGYFGTRDEVNPYLTDASAAHIKPFLEQIRKTGA